MSNHLSEIKVAENETLKDDIVTLDKKKKDRKETDDKYAKDWKLELFALNGFCVSGFIFISTGIQNGDYLTVLGSVVWIVSCIVWMIPYRKHF